METIAIIILVIGSLVIYLGVLGNGVVIWVTGFKMKKTAKTVWYLNLAVADFIVTAFLPLQITTIALDYHWPFGTFMCKMVGFVFFMNMCASIYTLVVISVDRCVSVVCPVWTQNHRNVRKAYWVSLGVWVLSLAYGSPFFIFRDTQPSGNDKVQCSFNYAPTGNYSRAEVLQLWTFRAGAMIMTGFLMGFVVPFTVIVSCYSVIIYQHRKKWYLAIPLGRSFNVTVVVITTFFLCWLPLHIMYLIHYVDLLATTDFTGKLPHVVTTGLRATFGPAILNSCMNPLLYVFNGQDFKDVFRSSVLKVMEKVFAEEPNPGSSIYVTAPQSILHSHPDEDEDVELGSLLSHTTVQPHEGPSPRDADHYDEDVELSPLSPTTVQLQEGPLPQDALREIITPTMCPNDAIVPPIILQKRSHSLDDIRLLDKTQKVKPDVIFKEKKQSYRFTCTQAGHWNSSLPRSHSHILCVENKASFRAKRSHSLNDLRLLYKTQEMNPVENNESYRFHCTQEELFQCNVTGLVFKMEAGGASSSGYEMSEAPTQADADMMSDSSVNVSSEEEEDEYSEDWMMKRMEIESGAEELKETYLDDSDNNEAYSRSRCDKCKDVEQSYGNEIIIPEKLSRGRLQAELKGEGTYECVFTGLIFEASEPVVVRYTVLSWSKFSRFVKNPWMIAGSIFNVQAINKDASAIKYIKLPHFLCLTGLENEKVFGVLHITGKNPFIEPVEYSGSHLKWSVSSLSPVLCITKKTLAEYHGAVLIYKDLSTDDDLILRIYLTPNNSSSHVEDIKKRLPKRFSRVDKSVDCKLIDTTDYHLMSDQAGVEIHPKVLMFTLEELVYKGYFEVQYEEPPRIKFKLPLQLKECEADTKVIWSTIILKGDLDNCREEQPNTRNTCDLVGSTDKKPKKRTICTAQRCDDSEEGPRKKMGLQQPGLIMPAKELLRRNKTKLQGILMAEIGHVVQCVCEHEEKLLEDFQYLNLKGIPDLGKAATELVDKIMGKGETTCQAFLSLLQDTKLTDPLPELKEMPWYNP